MKNSSEPQVGNLLPIVCIVYLKLLNLYPLFYTSVNLIWPLINFSEVSGFFWSLFSSGCVFPLVTLYMLLPPPSKLGLIKIRIAGTCLVLLREREKE